jgi:hypothetical protein
MVFQATIRNRPIHDRGRIYSPVYIPPLSDSHVDNPSRAQLNLQRIIDRRQHPFHGF